MTLDEAVVRAWCQFIARPLACDHISPKGTPYLDRYFVAGWNPTTRRPGPSMFLHHFLGSDPDGAVHSHPWEFGLSVILVGRYREERCLDDGAKVVRDFGPGDVNVIHANDRHRIELLTGDVWSLFLTGAVVQSWNFSPLCR